MKYQDFTGNVINFYAASLKETLTLLSGWKNWLVNSEKLRRAFSLYYGELRMNLITAINVFLRQSLRVGGFPFEVQK